MSVCDMCNVHAYCIVHTHFNMCTRRYNKCDNNSESGIIYSNSGGISRESIRIHHHTIVALAHSHFIPNWRHFKCLWYYNQEHIFQCSAHCYCILYAFFFDKNNRLVDFFSIYYFIFRVCFTILGMVLSKKEDSDVLVCTKKEENQPKTQPQRKNEPVVINHIATFILW